MDVPKVSSPIQVIGEGAWKVVKFVGYVIAVMFLLLLQLGMLSLAMKQHWTLGFPIVAIYCIGIYKGLEDFRTGKITTLQGIQVIISILLLTILGFAFLSFALNRFGLAHFTGFSGQTVTQSSITGDFIGFYLWQLFELIPGLKINEVLGRELFGSESAPLEHFGFVAGFCLIAFRVVIVFVLLKVFRDWWAKRGVGNNKELIRRWFTSVWNEGRPEAIAEMFAENGLAHGLSDNAKSPLLGPVAFKEFHAKFRAAFPNIIVTVEDAIAEGDRVVARCSVSGTHTGDSLGIAATQKTVDFTGIAIARIKDGKIVEAWNNFDFMTMNSQIGAT